MFQYETLHLPVNSALIHAKFFFVFIILLIGVIFCVNNRFSFLSDRILILLAILFIFYSDNIYLNRPFDINIYSNMTMWIFVYFSFLGLFNHNYITIDRRDKFVVSYVFLFAFLFLINYLIVVNNGRQWAFIESYFLLTIFPFVILLENSRMKSFLVLMISVCIILAAKRTGIIALLLCLLFYFNDIFKGSFQKKMYVILILCIILPVVYYLSRFFLETEITHIVDRFANISEDKGSGRVDMYNSIFYKIINTDDIWVFMFGNGYNSVRLIANGYSAHNDFLEVFYDYGLFGFILYLSFIISLIMKIFKKGVSYKLKYAMTLSLALFVLFSSFSHMILNTTSITCLCAFWSYYSAALMDDNIGEYEI